MSERPQFRVGRVPFLECTTAGKVECGLCGQKVSEVAAASHAQRRHKTRALGVLAGQLGLPMTDTPDVPR